MELSEKYYLSVLLFMYSHKEGIKSYLKNFIKTHGLSICHRGYSSACLFFSEYKPGTKT